MSTNAFKDTNLSSSEPSKPPNNALSASSVALLCSLAFGVAPLDDELLKCAVPKSTIITNLYSRFRTHQLSPEAEQRTRDAARDDVDEDSAAALLYCPIIA
mgnify:CR=1 FL=1